MKKLLAFILLFGSSLSLEAQSCPYGGCQQGGCNQPPRPSRWEQPRPGYQQRGEYYRGNWDRPQPPQGYYQQNPQNFQNMETFTQPYNAVPNTPYTYLTPAQQWYAETDPSNRSLTPAQRWYSDGTSATQSKTPAEQWYTNNSRGNSQQIDYRGNQQFSDAAPPRAQQFNNTSTYDEDRRLEKEIRDALAPGMFSRGFDQLIIQVSNGTVALRGAVPTIDDKNHVEQKIRNMRGVRNLNSQLAVQQDSTINNPNETRARTNYGSDDNRRTNANTTARTEFNQDRAATPADKQLNMKIRDKVSSGWLWNSYTDVVLVTSNGDVILEGFVSKPEDQQKLIDEIRKVEGVGSIRSNLRFKNP